MNPQMLTSFLHSHPLTLMVRNPLVPSRTHRTCEVCRESIEGDFYGCNHCPFHVHQYCTSLPNSLRHVIDQNHKLTLLKLSSGKCSICKGDCSSLWVYACTVCKVNIHLKCLRKPFGNSREKTDWPSGSRGVHHHHHAPPQPPPWMTRPPYFEGWGNPSNQFGHHGHVQFPYYNPQSHHTNHGHGNSHGHGQGHDHSHSHGHDHGHGHGYDQGHGRPSGFGSMMGTVMFTLVQNLTMGALADFIFGSIEF